MAIYGRWIIMVNHVWWDAWTKWTAGDLLPPAGDTLSQVQNWCKGEHSNVSVEHKNTKRCLEFSFRLPSTSCCAPVPFLIKFCAWGKGLHTHLNFNRTKLLHRKPITDLYWKLWQLSDKRGTRIKPNTTDYHHMQIGRFSCCILSLKSEAS